MPAYHKIISVNYYFSHCPDINHVGYRCPWDHCQGRDRARGWSLPSHQDRFLPHWLPRDLFLPSRIYSPWRPGAVWAQLDCRQAPARWTTACHPPEKGEGSSMQWRHQYSIRQKGALPRQQFHDRPVSDVTGSREHPGESTGASQWRVWEWHCYLPFNHPCQCLKIRTTDAQWHNCHMYSVTCKTAFVRSQNHMDVKLHDMSNIKQLQYQIIIYSTYLLWYISQPHTVVWLMIFLSHSVLR